MIGYVNSIETMALVDGPGVRFLVFLNGCNLRCLYCHNPEMWNKNIGTKMTPEELLTNVKDYLPYYKNGEVTFSGGEPLLQPEFLINSLKLLKDNNIHTAIDTSGVGLGNYEEILKYTDLVILDIKATNEADYKYLTGKNMSEFNNFLQTCISLKKKMWVRMVIVPGINDNIKTILELNEFLRPIKNIDKIELLPYHTFGKEKYSKLNIPYKLDYLEDMRQEKIDELSKFIDYYS